jgi:hypothetical protein
MTRFRFPLLIGSLVVVASACGVAGPFELSLAETQSGSGRNRANVVVDASATVLRSNVAYTVDAVLPEVATEAEAWSLNPAKESKAALKRLAVVLNIGGEVITHERNSFSIGTTETSDVGLWLWADIGGAWWSMDPGVVAERVGPGVPVSDAITRTTEMLTAAEIPMQGFEFVAVQNASVTEVVGSLIMNTVKTNVVIRFTFAADGSVIAASGPLLDTKSAGNYPVISPTDAVARLTNPSYASTRLSNISVDTNAGTPASVPITGAEQSLMQIVLNNKSTMLLPAYTFTNAAGVVGTVLAVQDQFLSYGDSTVTGGVTTIPTAKQKAYLLVGLVEAEATKAATSYGWRIRIAQRDAEQFMLTTDYQIDRVNFTIMNGIVTAVTVG